MKFITNNLKHPASHIGYKEKCIEMTVNKEFLGLQIDNHINCKNQIEQTIPKQSATCYDIGSMVHTDSINSLKSIRYALFHSL